MGLGAYPDVSLADARDAAAHWRKILKSGIDPIDHRNAEAARTDLEAARIPRFTQAAAAYIRINRHGWSNPKHARQWAATLKTYARPVIGAKPVDQVTTEDILEILQPIWVKKTETAKRVQSRIENVLDFSAARHWRDPINPARWRGHLNKLLPKPSKVATRRHQPALPYAELPAFMRELGELRSMSALALRFLILTACRSGEVLGARWTEIDTNAAIWIIPAQRTKARREHRVPLSGAALDVLAGLSRIDGNPFVFTGARQGKPLSNMALLQVMRGMGYGVGGHRGDAVPHGFRSSFRDWAGEVSSFPRDVCEMALAHVIENKAEAAYRRGDPFDKRRAMMNAWADWCQQAHPHTRPPATGRRAVLAD
jgi:integrase